MFYFFIFTVLVLIILLIISRLLKYESINKLPGPNWFEVFKLFVWNKSNIDFHSYILNLGKRYGPVIKIWVKPFQPILIVSDPKYFEAILGSKEHLHKTKLYDLLLSIAGNGIGTVTDLNKWKSDRLFFNPIFKQKSVCNYISKLKYHMDNLKKVIITYENKPVDTYLIIHHCAIYIILEFLIDKGVSKEIATKIIQAFDKSLAMCLERSYSAIKLNNVLFRFTKMYKTWVDVHDILDNTFMDLIHKCIQWRKDNPTERVTEKKNLMSLLLESDTSESSILGHLKTFVVAGFDTVAATASFALFEIAKRQDVQEKILNEYLFLAGTNTDYILNFDDLQNMKYTESVIKEVMRMYPAVPLIERKLKSPIIIDGFRIPEDTDIVFSITSLHTYNFPNPEMFDPDRFSAENINNVKPYSYAPFSLGPRNCIGQKLAMIELKFIISHIVRDFTLHAVEPEHNLTLSNDFTLKSKNGIPIIFKERPSI